MRDDISGAGTTGHEGRIPFGGPIKMAPAPPLAGGMGQIPQYDQGSEEPHVVGEENAVRGQGGMGIMHNSSGIPLNGLPGSSAPAISATDGDRSGDMTQPASPYGKDAGSRPT